MTVDFEIKDYDPVKAEELVTMWRASKREALGDYTEPHDFDSFLSFLREKLSKTHTIKMAVESKTGAVLGFVAFTEGDLDQIYIRPDSQGAGIGIALLDIAKRHSPNGLKLYTFQCNKKAQKFYEKHGFRVLQYGTVHEETLPDILYGWDGI